MMTIRKLDGSYAAGGKFHSQIAESLQPAFNVGGNPVGIFVLLSMLSTSFVAHYNAPKFYSELKDKVRHSSLVTRHSSLARGWGRDRGRA